MRLFPASDRPAEGAEPGLYLRPASWDDFGYKTLHSAWLVDSSVRDLGALKILQPDRRTTALPHGLDALPEGWLSAPVDPIFYTIAKDAGVEGELRTALRDIRDASMEQLAAPGVQQSLLRSPGIRALVEGIPRANRLRFSGILRGFESAHELDVSFRQGDRIAALVGPNGSGKTQLFDALAHELSGMKGIPSDNYDRVIGVAFSAFDDLPAHRPWMRGVPYTYLGLRTETAGAKRSKLDLEEAEKRLHNAVRAAPHRRDSWLRAIEALFPEGTVGLQSMSDPWSDTDRFWDLVHQSGSGHRVALMTITGLACALAPRTLVLMDEPEAHLHPQLLACMLGAVRCLLEEFDSHALIATHSPIPLQELPGRMVWRIHAIAGQALIDRYPGETFGASLSELVGEAFAVKGSDANFRRLLRTWLQDEPVKDVRARVADTLPTAATEVVLRAHEARDVDD